MDQDTETKGIQNETATREVEENTKALAGAVDTAKADDDALNTDNPADNVGSTAVMAKDPDPNEDPLIYTLSGADAGSVQGEGQWSDRGGRRDEVGLRGDQDTSTW